MHLILRWTLAIATLLLATALAVGQEGGPQSALAIETSEGFVNRDGTPLFQQAQQVEPTDAQKLVTPDAAVVSTPVSQPCAEPVTITLECNPSLCATLCRYCLGLGGFEHFAPLASSGTSHLDSALVGSRFIFRYDLGYGMTHPDRAEYYMARNRSVPAGGGRGLLRPETNVDAQELNTYIETAFSPRFSTFLQMPARFLNLEVNKDYYGWGDLNAGFKFTYCVEEYSLQTVLFRVYMPTGDSYHGLGTGHTTLEPGLLVYERLTPGLVVEAQLSDLIPIDGTISAGNILRYGLSFTYDLYTSSGGTTIKPVLEAEGWTVLRGMQTDVYPTEDPFTYKVIETENRDTIINASLGVRVGNEKGDIYLGYTKGLTGPKWFDNALRLELRLLY